MDLQNLKYSKVYIQCTWANAFVNPVWDRGECIVSYDRNWIRKYFANLKSNKILIDGKTFILDSDCIGFLTGKYEQTPAGEIWVEVYLNYCNRRNVGLMRLNDIWFNGKETVKNTDDVDVPEIKKTNTTLWVSIGLGLLQLLRK